MLENLNDRLAVFIHSVKYLETNISKLTHELHSSQERTTREVSILQVLYECEFDVEISSLAREAEEKAALILKVGENF